MLLPSPSQLRRVGLASSSLSAPAPQPELVRGRRAVLRWEPALRALAEQCGQPGAADDLNWFFSRPDLRGKEPVLVLKPASPAPGPRLHPGPLADATLLYEHRVLGVPLNLYTTADLTGRRTVLAPAAERAAVAARAANALLGAGAYLVHIAYQPSAATPSPQALADTLPPGTRWAATEANLPLCLALGPTYTRTLERIGQRTRSNLRYYRRRAEREIGLRYLPTVQIGMDDFLRFNRQCMYRVPEKLARWRLRSQQLIADPLLAGIEDGSGRWLALVGGRRHGTEVEIDWQMNRADLPHLSLSIVLRSCLIEDEVRRGTRHLLIEGGTPHPIGHSFTTVRVAEFTACRQTLVFRATQALLPSRNYLRQLLTDPALHWHTR